MQITPPTWQMKIPCPYCGQGAPIFVSCATCGYLTAHCDEVGETFKSPRRLEQGFVENCPVCDAATVDFELASSQQILAAGFDRGEYE